MQQVSLHDESAVTSVPETTRLQDLKALVKMGIVNSNTLTVFTGFWLALHFNGLSVMDNLDKLFFYNRWFWISYGRGMLFKQLH